MSDNAIYTEEIDGFRLNLYQDEDAESPYEWDDLYNVAFFHRRYDYAHGIGKDFNDPEDYDSFVKETPVIALPLYMYDHSGITFNTRGFSCPWDSGQVGYVFITCERVRKEWGWKRITQARKTKIYEALESFVKVLDQYVSGEVYGYVIEQYDEDDPEYGDTDQVDSCWGFYGYDYALEEAQDVLESVVAKHSRQTLIRETAIGL